LETRGHRTGITRTVPVVVVEYDAQRWLVSIFGETSWVANIRDAGEARLRCGQRAERIRVEEITDPRRAEVAMRLHRTARLNPSVRNAWKAVPKDGVSAFEAEAHLHPVFRIIDDPAASASAVP
jgi:deazaflavin-dependent oxidoreductase (nitroreductase family)